MEDITLSKKTVYLFDASAAVFWEAEEYCRRFREEHDISIDDWIKIEKQMVLSAHGSLQGFRAPSPIMVSWLCSSDSDRNRFGLGGTEYVSYPKTYRPWKIL
ncbi:MAG: hypothetical protein AAF662_05290 [Pseudomonadota bacterium]